MWRKVAMARFAVILLCLLFFASCHHTRPSHRYLHDKHDASEEIAKGQKKASKKADKDFHKTLKKNKKNNIKKGNKWSKKKGQYT